MSNLDQTIFCLLKFILYFTRVYEFIIFINDALKFWDLVEKEIQFQNQKRQQMYPGNLQQNNVNANVFISNN